MTLLIIIIVLAIIFDFINGFHDAANSIATVVSTKVLTPAQAVIWAAFFNFVAYFIAKFIIGGFGIADTVSKTVDMSFIQSVPCNCSRPYCCHCMESDNMVVGHPLLVVSYTHRWICRRRYCGSRISGSTRGCNRNNSLIYCSCSSYRYGKR